MLHIRRIYDDVIPANKSTLDQVKQILRSRFSAVGEDEIELIGEKLRNPFKQRFRMILFVAESIKGKVRGFATILHEPEIRFVYLDWIATASGRSGGVGGALYQRVRREAKALGVKGLFFECLPDDAKNCADQALLKENRARLRFYEQYGARPVVGTAYESPVSPADTCMPHLVYDGLDNQAPLRNSYAKKVVQAILERKYADYCPADYVKNVVSSFTDDPVSLRPLRYVKPEAIKTTIEGRQTEQVTLVVNDKHDIHHVHERGYVESPVRIKSILESLEPSGLFMRINPRPFSDKHLRAVHDPDFVRYLKKACAEVPADKALYPYVFPIRNKMRLPKEASVLSGYYCIDTFTPINANVYPAARRGVDCALTAAREVLDGQRMAYALIRPPGHHAERRVFGGFCYFNNCAIAAQYLSSYGKVAILDIDYHHGNGEQEIFYGRSDVLTISIHGHPSFAYPYFSGFSEERGEGDGEGFNLNLPLPEAVDGEKYRKALIRAIRRIEQFVPQFLVVALGLDPAKADPTGTWFLTAKDFVKNGKMIGVMGLPTVVIQEGGYRTKTLGTNAMAFFRGLAKGNMQWADSHHAANDRIHGALLRDELQAQDVERVRRLVENTGFFSPAEVDLAAELVSERLAKGADSGYEFVLVEHYGRLAGYACYGPIPATAASYDLYWIAVPPDFQGKGLGRRLLKEVEKRIRSAGGKRIYVDTSQRAQYAGTRAFYERSGYRLETVLEDFYGRGDGKAIYCKKLK